MKSVYKKELMRIKKEKGLTARNVLEEAKKKKSPLHKIFDWNNKVAGTKWRLHQARKLILQVRIEYEGRSIPEFIQVTVQNDGKHKEYVTKEEVEENNSWKQAVLKEALDRLYYWKAKYKYLSELSPILKGIEEVEENLDKEEIEATH